ncbi:uncharacterized protein ACIB01_019587 [Guaruba guarouba]
MRTSWMETKSLWMEMGPFVWRPRAIGWRWDLLYGDQEPLGGDEDLLDGEQDPLDGDGDLLDGEQDPLDGDGDLLDGEQDPLDGGGDPFYGARALCVVSKTHSMDDDTLCMEPKSHSMELLIFAFLPFSPPNVGLLFPFYLRLVIKNVKFCLIFTNFTPEFFHFGAYFPFLLHFLGGKHRNLGSLEPEEEKNLKFPWKVSQFGPNFPILAFGTTRIWLVLVFFLAKIGPNWLKCGVWPQNEPGEGFLYGRALALSHCGLPAGTDAWGSGIAVTVSSAPPTPPTLFPLVPCGSRPIAGPTAGPIAGCLASGFIPLPVTMTWTTEGGAPSVPPRLYPPAMVTGGRYAQASAIGLPMGQQEATCAVGHPATGFSGSLRVNGE